VASKALKKPYPSQRHPTLFESRHPTKCSRLESAQNLEKPQPLSRIKNLNDPPTAELRLFFVVVFHPHDVPPGTWSFGRPERNFLTLQSRLNLKRRVSLPLHLISGMSSPRVRRTRPALHPSLCPHRDGWCQPPTNPRQTRATAFHAARESAGKNRNILQKTRPDGSRGSRGSPVPVGFSSWTSTRRMPNQGSQESTGRSAAPDPKLPCSRLPRTYRVRIKLTESSGPEQTPPVPRSSRHGAIPFHSRRNPPCPVTMD
jgi:hypothetical protein